MLAEGFKNIETMECLQREYQVKNITLPEVDDYNFSFNQATDKVIQICNALLDVNLTIIEILKGSQGNENKNDRKFRAVLPALQMAGHTGYLTFATWPRQSEKSQ